MKNPKCWKCKKIIKGPYCWNGHYWHELCADAEAIRRAKEYFKGKGIKL